VVTLVAIAAAFIDLIDVDNSPSLPVIVSNLLLIQAWGIADSIVAPTWSISTEWAAYLGFPLFVAATINGGWRRCSIAALASVAVLVFVATRTDIQIHEVAGQTHRNGPMDVFVADTPFLVLRCLAGFTLGLFAYRLAASPAARRILRRNHLADLAALVVLGLLLIPNSDVLLILAFVPLVICLSTGTSLSARMTAHGVVYWLGVVSYSIYLNHVVLENLLRHPLMDTLATLHIPHGFTVAGLVLMVPLLALSAATYYGIEKPARAWSRRLVSARRQMAM
jgi:peptidoglycan/LPS O-acetylase OafA/YrhL